MKPQLLPLLLAATISLAPTFSFAIDIELGNERAEQAAEADAVAYVAIYFMQNLNWIAEEATHGNARQIGSNAFNGHVQDKIARSSRTCDEIDCMRTDALARELRAIHDQFFADFIDAFRADRKHKRRDWSDSNFNRTVFNRAQGSEFESRIHEAINPIIKVVYPDDESASQLQVTVTSERHNKESSDSKNLVEAHNQMAGHELVGRGTHTHSKVQWHLQKAAEKAQDKLAKLERDHSIVRTETHRKLVALLQATFQTLGELELVHKKNEDRWLPGDYVLLYAGIASAAAETIEQMFDDQMFKDDARRSDAKAGGGGGGGKPPQPSLY